MSTILDDGKAARDIAARQPTADNDYEIEVHAAACWLVEQGWGDELFVTHYTGGSTLWRTMRASLVDEANTVTRPVRRKVDWLRAREAATTNRPPLAPDPEIRAAVRDRLFGKEGES